VIVRVGMDGSKSDTERSVSRYPRIRSEDCRRSRVDVKTQETGIKMIEGSGQPDKARTAKRDQEG
jgi:hypothetical protein